MPMWRTLILTFLWFTSLNFGPILALRTYNADKLAQLRDEVKQMFYHSYDSYIRYAYPYDELRPLSCDGVDSWGSYSLTLIDSLDTLVVMGNYSEFRRVAELIINNAQFDLNINVSVFETNIRIIGGLLSAHLLSYKAGMDVEKGWPCNGPLLRLAEKVARKLIPAFDTKTGMPYGTVNLRNGVPPNETPITCTAGVGTFIVEFGALSRLTGDPLYEKVALRALHSLYSRRSPLDLVGNHIDTDSGKWTAIDSGIGAGVDSYFEYLVKGSILFQRPELMHMFQVSYNAIKKHLEKGGWYVWATMNNAQISAATFQSLEAFWPGLLSLVGKFKPAGKAISNYHRIWKQYGGLPELYNILQGKASTSREVYPLRPELIESAMYLYRATNDPFMLEIGEDMLHSIQKIAKTECGYATIRDVSSLTLEDRMESFFLAETIKYLYLLFDPDNFIHNDGEEYTSINTPNGKCTVYAGGYIFNTEAHPIDPSALDCCTGHSDKELHEEVAIIDEFDVKSEKFEGRKEEIIFKPILTTPKVDDSKDNQQQQQSENQSENDEVELLKNQMIELSYLESLSLENEVHPILLLYYNEKHYFSEKGGICLKQNKLILDSSSASIAAELFELENKKPLSPEEQASFLERLLKKLFDDETEKEFTAKIESMKGNLGDKSNLPQLLSSNEYQVKAQLSKKSVDTLLNSKKIEKLIQTFESKPISTTMGTDNNKVKNDIIIESKGHKNEKVTQGSSQTLINKKQKQSFKTAGTGNRIYLPPKGTRETPDLDLIFFGTSGKSLSFSFSLRWLKYFPELIRQLIPTEKFDVQNFFLRMNQHFTPSAFSQEFNISLKWMNGYQVLSCPSIGLTDRFLFFKSSVDD